MPASIVHAGVSVITLNGYARIMQAAPSWSMVRRAVVLRAH